MPSAKIVDDKKYSILSDYIGRPAQAYNEKGEIVWEAQYDIYGKITKLVGEKTFVPFRQLGQYEDEETPDLYYNRFRFYDCETGLYISQDPIGLAGNNPNMYAYTFDSNTEVDVFGLDCVSAAKKSIKEQLSKGKNARVSVNNRADAEALLRDLTSGPGHKGGYMDTTDGVFSPKADASDWLPRPSSSKRGTYHWDEFNPNAKVGDHAIEGSHLQIHTFEGKIIRIFY